MKQCERKEKRIIYNVKKIVGLLSTARKAKSRLYIGLSATAIVVTGALIFQYLYTPAYAVAVNGENIGIVANAVEYDQAVALVEEQAADILGEEYKLERNADVTMTLAAKEEIVSSAELKSTLLSQVEEIKKSYVLKVDGAILGAADDKATLQAMLDKITAPFVNENTTDYRFEEAVTIDYEFIAADTQSDPNTISAALSANIEEAASYTVVSGDTYSEIANDNGMRLSELMALNAQAELDELMIGDVLNIKTAVPFLSVKTIEQQTYDEAIESPIEYVDDASMYVGDTKTIKDGTPGTAKVTADVSFLNGNEISRTVLETTTLVEPIKTIIAKGTTPRQKTASYGSYIWPVSGTVTSRAGNRQIFGGTSYHAGLDIAVPYGTAVKASDGGKVTFSGWNGDYGKLVIITHDNGTQTYYAHNSSLLVSQGERVYQGQAIAKAGSTGRSTGNHSHFEVRVNGSNRDPYNYL